MTEGQPTPHHRPADAAAAAGEDRAEPQDAAMSADERRAALRALNEFGCRVVIDCLADGGFKVVVRDAFGGLCSATSPDPLLAFSQAHATFVQSHARYSQAYRAYRKAQEEQKP